MANSSCSNDHTTASASSEADTQEAPTSEADAVLLAFIDRVATVADGPVAVEYTGTIRADQVDLKLLRQQLAAAASERASASSGEKQGATEAGGGGGGKRPENQPHENTLEVPNAQQQQNVHAAARNRKWSANRTLSSVVRVARVANAVSGFWGARSAQLQRLQVLEPWNINRIALEEHLELDPNAAGGGSGGGSSNGTGDNGGGAEAFQQSVSNHKA